METTIDRLNQHAYSKDKFIIDPYVLDQANEGNVEALYQVGLQAFTENRLGFAKIFLQLAAQRGHILAKGLIPAVNEKIALI